MPWREGTRAKFAFAALPSWLPFQHTSSAAKAAALKLQHSCATQVFGVGSGVVAEKSCPFKHWVQRG